MTGTAARAVQGYRRTQSHTSSPLELVVMLYDGAIRFLGDAEAALVRHDRAASANAISRTMAIVIELQCTLDLDRGGSVASELDRLYDYVRDRLLDASRDQDAGAVGDAQRVLRHLADAWRQIAGAPAGPTTTPPPVMPGTVR